MNAMLSRLAVLALSLRERAKRALNSNLARGGAFSLLIQAQLVMVQLAAAILLARRLGPASFGMYSFALAVVTLIQVMPQNGLDNVVIRYSAQYRARRDWSMLRGLWRMAFAVSTGYGLVTAGLVVSAVTLKWLPAMGALSPSVLAVAAVPMLFLPLTTLFGAAIRAVNSGVVGQLPQFVVKPWVFILLLLALATLAPEAMTAETAMYAQGAAALISAVLGIHWLRKFQPEQARGREPTYEAGRWLRSALPFSLMGGLMLINTQADMLMLGVLGSAHDTGIYKVAANGANLVAISLTAANLYIAPRISALYHTGERKRLQRLLSLSARSTFSVALLIACVFWFWGSDLIRIVFGKPYLAAFWPLAILCLGQLVNVGSGSVGVVLSMTGNEADAARLAGLAAVANVALNAVLIPQLGGIGAATATAVSMFVWNGLMLHRVKVKVGVDASVLIFRTS